MILLLENKRERAYNSKIDFQDYENDNTLKTVFSDNPCDDLLDNFLEDQTIFDKYKTIIIHESIYKEEARKELFNKLEKYCKDENKSLIEFSGNNSQALVTNVSLKLSVKSLYENLETFLKMYREDMADILMLAYGIYWDLNPLLHYLEKLNIFIEDRNTKEKTRLSKFKKDYGLFSLKKILKEEEYQLLLKDLSFKGQEVNKEEMIILASNFQTLIQEKTK